MTAALTLRDAAAVVEVLPALGGGLARYDLLADGGAKPLLRRAPAAPADPFALACNPLVPWSNRISGGGFHGPAGFHALAPNVPGEPCPLHGNGFQLPWQVTGHAPDRAALRLASAGPGPFRYTARLRYRLARGCLHMHLSVRHEGEQPLPYGLGFHPWLPRDPDTTFQAPAEGVWLEDAHHLPQRHVPVGQRPDWDFTRPRPLPEGWVNNGFTGWTGTARIAWPGRRLALGITAEALSVYLLFSPGQAADFFCFEPVSHPVDAHNLPGRPGLLLLAPGGSASVRLALTPEVC